jgi:hypothetical protein
MAQATFHTPDTRLTVISRQHKICSWSGTAVFHFSFWTVQRIIQAPGRDISPTITFHPDGRGMRLAPIFIVVVGGVPMPAKPTVRSIMFSSRKCERCGLPMKQLSAVSFIGGGSLRVYGCYTCDTVVPEQFDQD